MSSGSYGYDAQGREITAGQRKAAEDKKGSRHADVIDTWDPTGLGSASEYDEPNAAKLWLTRSFLFSVWSSVWHQ